MWLKRTRAESTAGAASFRRLRGTVAGAVMTRRVVRAGTRHGAGRAKSLGLESVCPLIIWIPFTRPRPAPRSGNPTVPLDADQLVHLTQNVICYIVAQIS